MKIQDIGFFIVLCFLLILRKDRWFIYAGLVSLLLAIPLFAKWIFFTAERLTWYAGAFFLVVTVSNLVSRRKLA
jgi:hypothetical protein